MALWDFIYAPFVAVSCWSSLGSNLQEFLEACDEGGFFQSLPGQASKEITTSLGLLQTEFKAWELLFVFFFFLPIILMAALWAVNLQRRSLVASTSLNCFSRLLF